VAAVGSLRENKPYVGVYYWHYGQYRSYYTENRSGGAKQVLESRLTEKFDDYVKTRTGLKHLFSPDLMNEIRDATSIETKKALIKTFLNLIGVTRQGRKVESFTDQEVSNLWTPFSFAVSQMNNVFGIEMQEGMKTEDFLLTKTGKGLLSDQGSFITAMVGNLNSHSSLVEVNSYIRGDGKKAYKFIDAS
jgi:hypothetical protein